MTLNMTKYVHRLSSGHGGKKKNIEVVFDEIYWNGGCSVHMVVRGRKGAGEADQAMPKGWTWSRRKQHSAPRWDLRSCCLYVSLSVSIGCLIACCIYLCLSDGVPVQLTVLPWRSSSVTHYLWICYVSIIFCLFSSSFPPSHFKPCWWRGCRDGNDDLTVCPLF